jgi:hypothetical protein
MFLFAGCATTTDAGPPFAPPPPSLGDIGDHVPCAAPDCKLVLSEQDALKANVDARGVDFKSHILIVIGEGGERYEAEAIDVDDALLVHAPICKGAVLRAPRLSKPLLIQRYQACR